MNVAFDPDVPEANQKGTILDAVTKDQLNIGLTGQIRYRVSEQNLYAYLFGVKRPIAHIIGYFVSILRERIANYEATLAPESDQPLIEKANAGGKSHQKRKSGGINWVRFTFAKCIFAII